MTLPLTPDELLTTTRAVRKRLDLTRPVPIELIRECLEIALQAPSGSNRQAWHWVVVTDAAKRAAVGEIYRRQVVRYAESRGFAGRLFTDRPDRAPVQHRVGDSVLWLGDHLGDVPVLVIPCIRTDESFQAVNQAGLWGSLLPAAWSYCLAARARGLGTAWTSLHLGREAEVAQILGIPEGVHQGALIPTAYYTGETFKPAAREPLDTVLHLDRW
ncbi:nitroreductase family protein [Streptosporangium fragile]|uniref:Nitroreductase family protein n=1 Tax=Streptosporangium fragile TaxID=46186 RepID=A0ABN3W3Y7_9ACTN